MNLTGFIGIDMLSEWALTVNSISVKKNKCALNLKLNFLYNLMLLFRTPEGTIEKIL